MNDTQTADDTGGTDDWDRGEDREAAGAAKYKASGGWL